MNTDDSVSIECRNAVRVPLWVSNAAWCWYLEKVDENALLHEFCKAGFRAVQQHGIVVFYDAAVVGQYAVDLLVEDTIMVALNAVKALDNIFNTQCINYLWATVLPLCLLLNFGKPCVEIRRFLNRP